MRLHSPSRILPLLGSFSLLCAPVLAQDAAGDGIAGQENPFAPAKELAKYDVMLGNWKGEGTAVMGAGGESSKWTATSSVRKVLGGHWIQEDLRVDFGGETPAPLVFRSFYGFDKENKQWVSYGTGNTGEIQKAEVHWIDGKLVTASIGKFQGKLKMERWSVTFAGDSYSFSGYEAIGNDRPYKHVTGKFERVKVAPASLSLGKVPAFTPASKQMAPLTKTAGTYRVAGWMIMEPGAPKTNIGATETIRSVYGGAGLEYQLKGDPIPNMGAYEGWGLMAWSSNDNCYQSLWLDNMGMSGLAKAYLRDGAIIMSDSKTMMGRPVVTRSVLKLNADGTFASISEHSMFGAGDPVHTFQASYEKQ